MGSNAVVTATSRLMIRLFIFLLHASLALGGGGSALLIGLSKDGKTGGGSTSWEMLVICMAVGAAVIIAGGLAQAGEGPTSPASRWWRWRWSHHDNQPPACLQQLPRRRM